MSGAKPTSSPAPRRGLTQNVSFVHDPSDGSPLPDLSRDTQHSHYEKAGSHTGTSVSGEKSHILDLRHEWILTKISEAFDLDKEGQFTKTIAERTLQKHDNYALLTDFFQATGKNLTRTIFVSMRKGAGKQKRKGTITSLFSISTTPPTMSDFNDKGLFFVRINAEPIKEISIETDVIYGSIEGPLLNYLHDVMTNVYEKQLRQTETKSLVALDRKIAGSTQPHVQAAREITALFEQFDDLIVHLGDASASLEARVELAEPPKESEIPTPGPRKEGTGLGGDSSGTTSMHASRGDLTTLGTESTGPAAAADEGTEGSDAIKDNRFPSVKSVTAAADIVKGTGVSTFLGSGSRAGDPLNRTPTQGLLFGDTFTNAMRDISLHWATQVAPEFIENSNNTMKQWIETIHKALDDTEQDLVAELQNDQIGPASELAHWKVRMAKLCSITDQLREQKCKRVITAVMGPKGDKELQKQWKELDIHITDAANEAKDNVKYLGTFDSLCKPLYRSTPDRIIDVIAPLLNAVRTIHSIARYYSTPERMLGLFIKITNQLIINCRGYIRGPKGGDIWDQPRDSLIKKLKACIDLSDAYQDQYHLIKEGLKNNPTHPQWDFNEDVIFGHFVALCNRLLKIIDLLNSVDQFSLLAEAKDEIEVEGIDQCIADFQGTFRILRRKRYDIIDFRQREFEDDYLRFTRTVLTLENKVQSLINLSFENVTRTTAAIRVLEQFKTTFRKGNLKVDLDSKYVYIMGAYKRDLELIRKMYELNKKDPPTPRNFPPAAGCIAWARQLHRRIEGPMKLFSVHPFILGLPEAKPTIQMYNKVAKALVKFEGLWFRGWCNAVDQARAGLQATLLVRDERTRRLYVNFDRQIVQLIREAKCLERMGIKIPPAVVVLCLQENRLKSTAESLVVMLTRYNKLVTEIPDMWLPLMQKRLQVLKRKIVIGATRLTWSSVNIEQYVEGVMAVVEETEAVLSKAKEMDGYRIQNNLEFVRNTLLIEVPNTIVNVDEFVDAVRGRSAKYAALLQAKAASLEIAVTDLVAVLSSGMPIKEAADASKEVMRSYERDLFEALLHCFQQSVKVLTDRFEAGDAYSVCWVVMPLFPMRFDFSNGNILITPGLNEIEETARRVVTTMLGTFKKVYVWNQDVDNIPQDQLVSFYREISTDFLIGVAVLLLKGTFEGLAVRVQDYVQCFLAFEHLWTESQELVFKRFFSQEPTLADIEAQFIAYQEVVEEINKLPEVRNMAAVSLHAMDLKQSLIRLAEEWSRAFAGQVRQRAEALLDKFKHEIDIAHNKLGQKIEDFEDLHFIMEVLRNHRSMEDEFEGRFMPTADIFKLLEKYHIDKEATSDTDTEDEGKDPVGDLLSSWRNLKARAKDKAQSVHNMQDGFRERLENFGTVLRKDADKFIHEYNREGPMVRGVKPKVASDRLRRFRDQFETLEHRQGTHWGAENLFGLPKTQYPEMERIRKELLLLSPLYDLYNAVLASRKDHEATPWQQVDFDNMTNELADFQNRCRRLPKPLRDWDAYNALKTAIDDLAQTLPLVEGLAAPYVRERHWNRLTDKTGFKFDMTEGVLLKFLLDAPLLANLESVEDVCYSAKKEAEIETKLTSISAMWREREFKFAAFRHRGDLMLKGDDTQEIVTNLEECEMVLASLSSSRYAGPFKTELLAWLQKLSVSSEIIENWLIVQSQWVYLEAVFSSADIARQLPLEAKRFQQIDKTWVKMMNNATSSPNVVQLCYNDEALQHLLPHLIEQMELCQKSLEGYLEMKRTLFPRFYFVSNSVLLEILGQSSDPSAVQTHLTSVFDNIAAVGFDESSRIKSIDAMISGEGERIQFRNSMPIEGNVEEWLLALENQMRIELKNLIRDLAMDLSTFKDFKELIQHLIHSDQVGGQLSLIGLQLAWVREVEDTLARSKSEVGIMKITNRKIGAMLKYLTQLTTEEMTKRQRVKVETMVTIQVHQRDVFESMVARHVKGPTDFEWLKQTRIYWKPEHDDMQISICDIDFFYAYEYLGCTERLVITPLTDRCYITLSQALGMQMGGAPAGPAGTGKTETVKDMGKQLGKYVVVFNCSDQMDYKGLGKTFKGLAMSGAWGCFDEFNRIELEVLSVVSQQIQCILTAMRDRSSSFKFVDGQELTLNKGCGLFITMNPGYAGRNELPENLKMLFRGVSMMVPDSQIIMRVKLAASGFQDNLNLSRKLAILYKLCKDQLSKQRHYDFGLRNVLSVLRTCGAAKREAGKEEEALILLRVVRDMNLSKLNDEDSILFVALLDDLFPEKKVATKVHDDLENAIADACKRSGMIDHPDWHHKIIQLYETSLVRHGIMVLGPSGSGKTSCIRTLMKALSQCRVQHKEVRMNPKAITAAQMYGRLDVVSNEWTDGIFSILWRKATKKKEPVWIWLDGPVDTIWIENLNSVLDDNKTLTLSNSDRITMTDTMRLVFEPAHLDNASPATVSRAGMIFMGPQILGWQPLVEAWRIKMIGKEIPEADILCDLAINTFEGVFQFMLENCTPIMPNADVNLVSTFLTLSEGLLAEAASLKLHNLPNSTVQRLFIFATVWSLGALLEPNDRALLGQYLGQSGLPTPKLANEGSATVYDHTVDLKSGEWVHWSTRIPEYVYPADDPPPFASIFVPTVDSVRCEFLIDLVARQGKGVLLTGESGTAKTVTLTNYLNNEAEKDPENLSTKFVSFSSTSSPLSFQRVIEGSVEKRQGKTYGPPGNRRLLVFIDDVNLPEINEWGDQVTNELLRQLLEDTGFYDLNKPGEFSSIVDLQLFCAMPHPGGGRNDVPGRLKRHFAIFNCTFPSPPSIERIFGSILEGHFSKETGFTDHVVKYAASLSSLTRAIWNETKTKMLPTPAKFHYVFNLRDFSRIVQGLLKARPEIVASPDSLMSLWSHECSRVLADRFIEANDVAWFDETLKSLVADHFDPHFARRVLKSAAPGEPLYFVDFLRDQEIPDDFDPDAELPDHRLYEPIPSMATLRARVEMFIAEAGEVHRGPKFDDLVMFDDALKHLVRIHRVIRTPRGSAMLVGVGGSGKQSLTKLASFIAGNEIFQLTITRTYNISNLLDDLKILYRTTGEKGKAVTFLVTDAEIKSESFLEYFNNILASGEVPNLFQKDEMEIIITELRAICRKERPNMKDTDANLYKFFIERVRENLHMVLCFSPVGEKFRQRSIKFPGLLSGCTIDWFWPWPTEALVAVSEQYLSDFDIQGTEKVKEAVAIHMANVHEIVQKNLGEYFEKFRRQVSVTPKSYLTYLNFFKSLYVEKLDEVRKLANNLTVGLDKLDQAAEDVKSMQVELEVKEVELAKAQEASDLILQDVTAETAAAEKKKAEVEEVQQQCEQLATKIAAEKAEAEAEYELAKPALMAAREALDLIKPNDIATLKKLSKPPNLIKRIMDGVLVVRRLDINRSKIDPEFYPDKTIMLHSYELSIRAMTDAKYLQYLMNFDADAMTDEDCELLQPYFEMEDFNFETAKAASGNVAGLCNWLRAMVEYHFIAKDVAPKIQAVKEAEYSLQQALKQVEDAKAQVAEKAAIVAAITVKYEAALEDKRKIQEDADLTKRRLESAHALITGLAGEKERWTEQRGELDDMIIRLVGDVVITSSFIAYAGPFNQEYRGMLQSLWIKDLKDNLIPISSNHNIIEFMADEGKIGEWNVKGLPTDLLSTQNGVLVTSTTKYPLLVDPQGQGRTWIMNTYGDRLKVTSLNDPKFKVVLEECVDNGLTMLIEDIEEDLDPILDPVLDKLAFRQGTMLRISVGGKDLDFNPNFKLFITTKLANPRFSPETSAKTAIIDFTVTEKGLEEQLLSIVYRMEKPELEQEREQLQMSVTDNKQKLIHLEKDLLFRLSNTKGNLVDDVELVNVLNTTKSTTIEVKRNLEESAETQEAIANVREEYRPVATRGSILYFLIDEMSLVNPMYQTSLTQFIRLFSDAIAAAPASHVQSKRVASCIDSTTWNVYKYISRGLFEEHKQLFVLRLCLKIDLQRRAVSHTEYNVFLKGGASLDLSQELAKPFGWLPDAAWSNLQALSHHLSLFAPLVHQVHGQGKTWKTWYDIEDCETRTIPGGFEGKLTAFQRMLFIRCWRPDRAILAASAYIASVLSQKYLQPLPLDLDATWREAAPDMPIICLLSPGSDPSGTIEALARKLKIECRAVSMGQGQDVHARNFVKIGMEEGGWTLLQNCHLGLKFLQELIVTIKTMDMEHVDPSFRLMITSAPHPKFPIGLLQTSIKLTNQPPQGVKAGLTRAMGWLTIDDIDVVDRKEWKPLLYTLCFMHTALLERAKFGALGWNIPYEFNQSDLSASVHFLSNHLYHWDVKKELSWSTIRYMICEVQYGGRITDDMDRRLMNTYGSLWLDNKIFAHDFKFHDGYTIPDYKSLQEMKASLENIPQVDTPEMAGLHINADIAFRTRETNNVLNTLLGIQPRQAADSGGETREDIVLRTANELSHKLPPDYVKVEVKKQLGVLGARSPFSIFLAQEVDRMQVVIGLVRRTLSDLKLAIAGTIILSDALVAVIDSLYAGQVPASWDAVSWPSPNLASWFQSLVQRANQYSDWLLTGRPAVFWLTGFFNPQGFITAMKQETTRAHKGQWSIDSLELRCEVLKHDAVDGMSQPDEGVYIHGLFLEGCTWDNKHGKLVESEPKVLFVPMPIVHLTAISFSGTRDRRNYECPVYKTPKRTDLNFIFAVDLRTDEPPDKWVLRGVAIICSKE